MNRREARELLFTLVFEYDFKPGAKTSGDTGWQVTLWEPSVIIYPEYPDRLKELLKNEKEERKN